MAFTNEDKANMVAMKLDGASYADIARKYNVSREYIRTIFSGMLDADSLRSLRYNKSCIYPGIKSWLFQNDKTALELSRMMGMSHPTNLYNMLNGKQLPKKDTIDRILAATGMTYEEAFGKPGDC